MARKREGLPAFLVFLSVLSLIIASIDVLPVASVSSLAPGLGSRVVAQNTGQIMDICVVDDTRALLVAKRGEVQVWTNGTLTTALALAAIRPVFVLHEMGLLSCLVDGPDLWLFYSTPGEQVVSRWIFNGSVVDEGSERVLLTIPINPKPPHMHAGSAMVFSSDKRHIYIATGDGMNCGTCIDVQNVTSYIGKVLRVDRDGQGVPRNPFWNGNGTSVQSRVFAKGFRNPWTMIPAPGSEDVLVFDVGRQGAESVKRVGAGTQGGWPCFEGRLRRRGFENLCLPALRNTTVLHQWLHNGRGSAIIGAAILPRAAFRSRFAGKVVFADYVRGGVFLADRSFKSVVQVASYAHGTSRIKVGPAGRLWLLRNFRKQVHEIYDETIQPPPYETDQPVSNCPVPTERGTVPSITNSSLLALTWATDREIGWKCERNDGIVGMPCAVDGRLLPGVTNGDSRPMTVDNRRYSFGFGVRGNSSITIPVNGLCGSLSFGYGLDDTSARSARVEFEVLVDGNSTFRSRPAGRARVRWREISVIGAQTIELRTRQTSSGNHSAQWIEPKLACGPLSPYIPKVTISHAGFNGFSAAINSTVGFSVAARTYDGKAIDSRGFAWQLTLRHCQGRLCHSHPNVLSVSQSIAASFLLPEHEGCVWYEVEVTAADTCGRTATAYRNVLVPGVTERLCAGSGKEPLRLSGTRVLRDPNFDQGKMNALSLG